MQKVVSGSYIDTDGKPGIWYIDKTEPVEVTDLYLIKKIDNKQIYINYDLSNNPTFFIEKKIDSTTTTRELNEFEDLLPEVSIGIIGTYIVEKVPAHTALGESRALGLDINNSIIDGIQSTTILDTSLKIMKNGETIVFEDGNIDLEKYLTTVYGENDTKIINDENGIYTYYFKRISNSDGSYTIRSEIIINKNSNFSRLGKNKTNNSSTATTSTPTKTDTSVTSSVTKDTSNINSIPKTGIEINKTVIVLYSIIVMAVVGIVILIVTSKKK